jgi:pilus assembly protein CpaE
VIFPFPPICIHGGLLRTAWKPLIICPQAELAGKIISALQELAPGAAATHSEYPRMGAGGALARTSGANICFLDVASNSEHAQMLIAEICPSIPVVALHHRNDADLILRCLRRGACEYLADPGVESVRAVFDRLGRKRSGNDQPRGVVYCVAPGKPGCGASSLATQLAVELHSPVAKVLLVDGDPMTASIAFMLKLKSEFHLGDALRDWKRMDDDLWNRLTVNACGVSVLPAPESAAVRIEITRPLAGEMCAWWRDRYAFTVLDMPDVRTAADWGFAALADAVLLVTTNELAALQSTRRAIAYLNQDGGDRGRLRLILNRYTPATGLRREDVKTALGLEPFATLSNDYEVMQTALLNGKPAPASSRFAASVHALCAQIGNKPASAKQDGSWLSGLFRRSE